MTTNLGSLDLQNEDKFIEELDALDEDTRRERIRSFVKERNDTLDSNRKLFARAKEAEGFKQDEEGNWVKIVEKKSEAKSSVKSDDKLLERLDNMALKIANISADDEKELYNKWKDSTGREADEIVGNKIFQAELADLRTAKANLEATSNIRGEQGGSEVKNDPDYWIAKATKDKDGKLLFPEETPKELYSKILNKIAEQSGGSSEKLKFYNQ